MNDKITGIFAKSRNVTGSYQTKVITSGNVVEIYQYDRPVYTGKSPNQDGRGFGKSTSAEENRKKHVQEIKKMIRRQINANYVTGQGRFITLTHRKNEEDLTRSHRVFNGFIKEYTKYMGYKLEYTAVIEFQERGSIHYHCVFYNLPKKVDLDDLRQLWAVGSVNVKRLNNVDNVGAYLTGYFSTAESRLKGRKAYLCSKGLKKPQEIKKGVDESVIGSYTHQGYQVKYSNTFLIEETKNQVQYTQVIKK
jgi:hypothetical protein